MDQTDKKQTNGAGILPYALQPSGELMFLFQQSSTGKKSGYLVDFGGGMKIDEEPLYACAREFCEETGGMLYDSESLTSASDLGVEVDEQTIQSSDQVKDNIEKFYAYLTEISSSKQLIQTRCINYHLFLGKIKYYDLTCINKIYQSFKKKRELIWINADDIIEKRTPFPLYPRIAEATNFDEIIFQINKKLN